MGRRAPYETPGCSNYDATIVERLADAGAVLVAKLTLGALAQGDMWFGGQDGEGPVESGRGIERVVGRPRDRPRPRAASTFGVGTETRGSIISPSSQNGDVPRPQAHLRPRQPLTRRDGALEPHDGQGRAALPLRRGLP